MSRSDRFLKACRCEPVDRVPVWLMRQAGRYMAAYRELRNRHGILDIIRTPELATEVTLQPLRAFDLDAAIIFSDILPLLECMGLKVEFARGEGPLIREPLREPPRLRRLPRPDLSGKVEGTLEAIRLVRRELDGRLPLIGFSGAPFTLACYAVEGGGSDGFPALHSILEERLADALKLIDRLAELIVLYAEAQVDAGIQAFQLFDTWAGLADRSIYEDHLLPRMQAIVRAVQARGVPVICFAADMENRVDLLAATGADVLGIGSGIPLPAVRDRIGPRRAIQGNLDPVLLAEQPFEPVRREARRLLNECGRSPGYIFNLGHGVLKSTPEEHVRALVELVHDFNPGDPP